MGRTGRWLLAAAAILVVGVGVRLPGLGEPYSRFHPARQYRDALVARDLSYAIWGAPSDDAQRLSDAAVEEWGPIEPPILESVAAVADVAEPDDLWRGRVLTVAGFLAGVTYLAWALRRVLGDGPALVALGAGVLLPYGTLASPSFQPDPLLAGTLCAAFGVLVGAEAAPLRRRGHVALGALGGLAGLLKLTAVPVLLFPYLWVHRRRWRSADVLLGSALVVGPGLVWWLGGIAFGDALDSQTEGRFLPELLVQGRFWRDWAEMVQGVFGWWVLAVVAVALAAGRPALRRVLAPALVGYLAAGVALPYLITTHDYYQLVLIPVVVVAVGATAEVAVERLRSIRPVVLAAAAVIFGAYLALDGWDMSRAHTDSGADRSAAVAEPYIGLTIDESLAFTIDDAIGLEYLTRSRVEAWPTRADQRLADLSGTDLLVGAGAARSAGGRGGAVVRRHPAARPGPGAGGARAPRALRGRRVHPGRHRGGPHHRGRPRRGRRLPRPARRRPRPRGSLTIRGRRARW